MSESIDWHKYFTEFRAQYQPKAEGEQAEPEEKSHVSKTWEEVALEKLPTKPKALATWLKEAGFEVLRMGHSQTWHPTEVYKADSSKKDAEGQPLNAKGSFKRGPRNIEHYWLHAALRIKGQPVAAFDAHWEGGSFQEVYVWDAYGFPTEFYFDYSGSAVSKTILARADNEYNDGELYLVKKKIMNLVGEFHEWLNQWAKLVGAEPLVVTQRAPKKTKEEEQAEQDAYLLEGMEWTG